MLSAQTRPGCGQVRRAGRDGFRGEPPGVGGSRRTRSGIPRVRPRSRRRVLSSPCLVLCRGRGSDLGKFLEWNRSPCGLGGVNTEEGQRKGDFVKWCVTWMVLKLSLCQVGETEARVTAEARGVGCEVVRAALENLSLASGPPPPIPL